MTWVELYYYLRLAISKKTHKQHLSAISLIVSSHQRRNLSGPTLSGSRKLWKRKGSVSGLVLSADVLSELGGVSLLAVTDAADTNDSRVDGARYAVRKLHVDLGHLEVLRVVRVVFLDISLWGGINHVTLLEALDCLVLWDHTTTVGASNGVRVSLVLLVPPVVSSLWWHI